MTDLRKAAEMALEAFEVLDRRGGLGLDVHEYLRTKIDALRQALAQPDEVLAEREACARLVEADGLARGDEGLVFIKAAGRIRARSEKPPVKSYCGGKPNYCTPEVTPEVTGEVTGDVDAVNTSQKRVDETAKSKHEPWPSVQCACGGTIYFKYTPPVSDYHEGWEEGFKAATREQEPFIYVREDNEKPFGGYEHCSEADVGAFPVYSAPPKREWVGIGEKEVAWLWFSMGNREGINGYDFAKAIEAKLKEKNGG